MWPCATCAEAPRARRAAALLLALALLVAVGPAARAGDDDPWERLPQVLARIVPPTFPARVCDITRHGARPGKDAGDAIRRAVDACHAAGGGRVRVPPGEWLTGPIHLKSGVELHLEAGATLRFDRDPARYLPQVLTRWEGVELMNYSPLVYAYEQENIAITGQGTLDGQADARHWWPWKAKDGPESQVPARNRLFEQAERGVPVAQRVYGQGDFLRPAFVQPYRCRNVLIEGVTIVGSPMWVIHPVLSRNVTVRGVKVVSLGPNNDGCNPESSSDVLIEDALFDTGDDCIALKSGRNADGRRLATPVEDVVVRRCQMRAGHGGVTVGSEISGGARRVWIERCRMSSPELERGLRFKTNAVRGGVIEDVFVRDVEIGEVGAAIDVDMLYEEGAKGAFLPVVRNVRVERLKVQKAQWALHVRTLPGAPLLGLWLRDTLFEALGRGLRLEGVVDLRLDGVSLPAPEKR